MSMRRLELLKNKIRPYLTMKPSMNTKMTKPKSQTINGILIKSKGVLALMK
jgi:hypothetical protein